MAGTFFELCTPNLVGSHNFIMCITGKILKLIVLAVLNLGKSMCTVFPPFVQELYVKIFPRFASAHCIVSVLLEPRVLFFIQDFWVGFYSNLATI